MKKTTKINKNGIFYLIGKNHEGLTLWLKRCESSDIYKVDNVYFRGGQVNFHDIAGETYMNNIETPLKDSDKYTLMELMESFRSLRNVYELAVHGGAHVAPNPMEKAFKSDLDADKLMSLMVRTMIRIYALVKGRKNGEIFID